MGRRRGDEERIEIRLHIVRTVPAVMRIRIPGSGIRCFFHPWIRIRDPGQVCIESRSRIRDLQPIFLRSCWRFSGKKTLIPCQLAQIVLYLFKNKTIFNYLIFMATKIGKVPWVLDVQHVEKKHDYENETCPVMAGGTLDFWQNKLLLSRGVYKCWC